MMTLEQVRRRKLWTQQELADKAGVSRSTVHLIETGQTRARLSIISRIAKALEVPPEEIEEFKQGNGGGMREVFRTKITPNQCNTDFKQPWSLDDKITIFSEQISGWQLQIADLAVNGGMDGEGKSIPPIWGAGIGALYIVISYFEMIAKYMEGYIPRLDKHGKRVDRASKEHFKKGIGMVFPELAQNANIAPADAEAILDLLYEGVRCGLYHSGVFGKSIILTGGIEAPMGFTKHPVEQAIVLAINPHKLVPLLRQHLGWYVALLRDSMNVELRQKFEKRFDFDRLV